LREVAHVSPIEGILWKMFFVLDGASNEEGWNCCSKQCLAIIIGGMLIVVFVAVDGRTC